MKKIDYSKYPYEQKIRHHVSAHNYLPIEKLKHIPENYPCPIGEMTWEDKYKNGNPPDILDIGCGRGHFLIESALLRPDKNFLGIEIRTYLPQRINKICENEDIGNCFALRYNVANKLDFIDSGSVEDVFWLFPDPWPKRKHFRRRAFNKEFVDEMRRILKPDGRLHLSTDCDYVDEYQRAVVEEAGGFEIRRIETKDPKIPNTNKEEFCLRKNIEVYRCVCEKK